MIHGIFYKKLSNPVQHDTFLRNQETLVLNSQQQRLVCWSSDYCWLAQAMDKASLQNPNVRLFSIGDPVRVVITAWARLDNREELAQLLTISMQELKRLSCAELILRAYVHFGEDCTKKLFGDFSFAIYDKMKNRLFCARDPMGVKPFYYYENEELFIFSSSFNLFHQVENVPIRPSMEWASKFLIAHLYMDFQKTAYHNIFKLAPAHQFEVTSKRTTLTRYHTFHTNKIQLGSSGEYVEYYRSHLESAMKSRSDVDHPLGVELSGGIDSSTVAAYAVKYFKRPLNELHTFCFASYTNESKYILQVNQHLRIPISHICCSISGLQRDFYHPFQVLGALVEHDNAVSHEIFYELASKHQVKTLLSGFGGDEFVTTLHGGLYLQELLKDKQFIKLYQTLAGNSLTRMLRLVKFCYKNSNQTKIKPSAMSAMIKSYWPYMILKEELVQGYGIKTQYEAYQEFLSGHDNLDRFTLEKRLAPFVSTRLENCTLMAARYGVEYRWPLLDVRLIQCFLSIPSSEKYYRGIGRYLHKRAVAEVLPQEIKGQNTKYMGERVVPRLVVPVEIEEELHPDLYMLLNLSRFKEQKEQLRKIEQNSTLARQSTVHIMRRNMSRINQLDKWLKYYFAKGCDWGR